MMVKTIRIHATNIIGIGAVQLVQSLLPELERAGQYQIRLLYLAARGELARYSPVNNTTQVVRQRRYLPKAIWRVLECTLLAWRFSGDGDLLVLGDIPLRCKGRQTVFVQTPLLTKTAGSRKSLGAMRYVIARLLFRLNSRFVSAFIVQTEEMRTSLLKAYPTISGRIHVIGQPAPDWVLAARLKRKPRMPLETSGVRLFYPAAGYPHKNHGLLSGITRGDAADWPVSSLILTLERNQSPNPNIGWIECVGRLQHSQMLHEYEKADALLFLSLSESLGFPLVEAMSIGLPIVCPNLPYARVICGDEAIYFDPRDINSLKSALMELVSRLRAAWWPDWGERMKMVPENWRAVSSAMLRVASGDMDVH